MAHKKGVGSSKNGRESESKRLGVKIFGGQFAHAGNILVLQRELNTKQVIMSILEKTIHCMPRLTELLSSPRKKTTNLLFQFFL